MGNLEKEMRDIVKICSGRSALQGCGRTLGRPSTVPALILLALARIVGRKIEVVNYMSTNSEYPSREVGVKKSPNSIRSFRTDRF